jgi:hypothetical protein
MITRSTTLDSRADPLLQIIIVPQLHKHHAKEMVDRGHEFCRQLTAMHYWKMHGTGSLQPALKPTSPVVRKKKADDLQLLKLQVGSWQIHALKI